ncbi:MAG: VPLPA-CTERM sorting domain-containing protein [Gammaproteobacteria bacterium]
MQSTTSIQAVILTIFVIGALVVARPAGAVTVIDNATGAAIIPGWFINPFSPAGETTITQSGTNFEIAVGISSFGSTQGGAQAAAIYGAGAVLPDNGGAGYKVVFTTQVFGWDSYDVAGTPAPGSTGYWDSFSVNINQASSYYWDMVDGGSGALTDPIIGTDPAGNCVGTAGLIAAAPACLAGAPILAGETWVWGALDFGNNTFEGNAGAYTLELVGQDGSDYFLSAVLDTATNPQTDQAFPSFGAFNPLTTVPPPSVIPLPAAAWLFGSGLIGLLGVARRKKAS